MYVPYSRLHNRKPSVGGEAVEQVKDSEIVIDPPDKSTFQTLGTRVYGVLDRMPAQQPIDSEAYRPGTEADEAIARVGKRVESTLDYFGTKVHDMLETVPPADPRLSAEATRPGTEVHESLARVGKHIEEYFSATTEPAKRAARQETSTALRKAAGSLDKAADYVAPTSKETLASDASKLVDSAKQGADQAVKSTHDTVDNAMQWSKDAQASLSGAAHEFVKSKKEGVSALQHEKEARRTTGSERQEHLKLAEAAREDQSAHASNAQQHVANLRPRPVGAPLTSPEFQKNESVFKRMSNWFFGK